MDEFRTRVPRSFLSRKESVLDGIEAIEDRQVRFGLALMFVLPSRFGWALAFMKKPASTTSGTLGLG